MASRKHVKPASSDLRERLATRLRERAANYGARVFDTPEEIARYLTGAIGTTLAEQLDAGAEVEVPGWHLHGLVECVCMTGRYLLDADGRAHRSYMDRAASNAASV
jgi:hypothetical protein